MTAEQSRRHNSFSGFFRRELLHKLEGFEFGRRHYIPYAIAGGLCVIGILLAAFSLPILTCLVAAASWVTLGIVLAGKKSWLGPNGQRMEFSREVIVPLAAFTSPRLIARPEHAVPEIDFLESRIFGYDYDLYRGTDYFHENGDGYHLAFSWLDVRKTGEKDGRQNARMSSCVFSGRFFSVTFRRNFFGRLLILPDVAEAALGWIGRSVQKLTLPEGMELLLLEDAEFEARFKVLGTGQHSARYILSPACMRLATSLDKRVRGGVSLSFLRNRMYVAIAGPSGYYDFSMSGSLVDAAFCRDFYHSVKGVEALAGHIARHQVIWADSP